MAKLDRTLGLFGLIAVSLGAMLGGSIFVLPAVASQITGASLWLAYLLAALLVLPAALSKSELATALPASGGSYIFVERCLGPLVGTIGGVGLAVSLILKAAFALIVLGSYLNLLAEVPAKPVALGMVGLVVVLNLLGVEKLGKIQIVVVGACFTILAGLVVEGAFRPSIRVVDPGPFLAGDSGGLLAAVGLVFFSYAGVTKVAAIAEEVRNPSKNIPRGMLISLALMAALYSGIGWLIVRVLEPSLLGGDTTPIASLAGILHGPVAAKVIAVTAVVALAGMANTGILAASRFPFAMSRDRLLPGFLQTVDKKTGVPTVAVLATGLAMAGAIVFLDVVKVAKLCSSFKIAVFALNNVALIVLRESNPQWYRPGFRAPLYPWVQLFGIGTGIVLLVAMGPVALVGLGGGVVVGTIAFFVYGRSRVSHLGVFRQLFPRPDLVESPDLVETRASLSPEESAEEEAAAHTVVALFGNEPSAESLVHLGATLADGRGMEVLRLQELPEHGEVFHTPRDRADRITSLRRRVLALAEERGVETHFDHVMSRDVRRSLYETAQRQHSRWVVLSWRERQRRGLVLRDPFSWLLNHLSANVAILKDAGIRTYRKILVLAEPGPHDVLVVSTADRLATLFRARIVLGRYAGTDPSESETVAIGDYHDQLSKLCAHVDGAEILSGPDEVDAVVRASARYDLLVLGAPPDAPVRRMLFGSAQDRIADEAHCAVLVLSTPRHETHEALDPAATEGFGPGLFLEASTIQARMEIESKEELFRRMAEIFADADGVSDPQVIERAFWERERLQNTAIGEGVALPHATVDSVERTVLGIVTLARPIEYETADGRKVDVCVVTVGPSTDRTTHLQLLSSMARLIAKGDLLDDLRAAPDPRSIIRVLGEAEQRVAALEAEVELTAT